MINNVLEECLIVFSKGLKVTGTVVLNVFITAVHCIQNNMVRVFSITLCGHRKQEVQTDDPPLTIMPHDCD